MPVIRAGSSSLSGFSGILRPQRREGKEDGLPFYMGSAQPSSFELPCYTDNINYKDMEKKIFVFLFAQFLCLSLFAQPFFKETLEKANAGDANAQCHVGNCYYSGEGVERNYSEAFNWFMKSADQGYSHAQYMVGQCYLSGYGVKQDLPEAFEWFMKSAEQGNAIAQGMVGLCYYAGQGVTRDYLEALEWLEKAAENGDISAQMTLDDKKISKKLYKAREKNNQ